MAPKDGQLVDSESTVPAGDLPPGYLQPETVGAMWEVVPQTKSKPGSSRSVTCTVSNIFTYEQIFCAGTEKMAMDWGGR